MSPRQAAVSVDTLSGLAPILLAKIVTPTIMTVMINPVTVAVMSDVDMSRRHSDELNPTLRAMFTNDGNQCCQKSNNNRLCLDQGHISDQNFYLKKRQKFRKSSEKVFQ